MRSGESKGWKLRKKVKWKSEEKMHEKVGKKVIWQGEVRSREIK